MSFRAVALWLLASVFIGPLLFGAVLSLFWSTAADTDDAQSAAVRLYELTRHDPASDLGRSRVRRVSCGGRIHQRLNDGDVTLISALNAYRRRWLSAQYAERGVNELQKLPAPIVGALESCIHGSPASLFCMQYVQGKVAGATNVDENTKQQWLSEIDRLEKAAWCATESSGPDNESKRAPEAP